MHKPLKFLSKNILVIGDIMLDVYYKGEINRISPEAPAPVFLKKNESYTLGGAGNVAVNLIAASQKVSIAGYLGDDIYGKKIIELFDQYNINTDAIVTTSIQTTTKTRFLAENNQQILRMDEEMPESICNGAQAELRNKVMRIIPDYDLVVLSDYSKGVLNRALTSEFIQVANDNGIPVVVDVKGNDPLKYSNATIIKPNRKELFLLTGIHTDTDENVIDASKVLKKTTNCQYVVTTCGGRGICIVGDDICTFIDAKKRDVFDVTGAGDTAIAYLSACYINGFNIKDACEFANCASSIQVSKVGTGAVSLREVNDEYMPNGSNNIRKLITINELSEFHQNHLNQKIVFTNGCFDILHFGHVDYLSKAKELGDILVVGLNSDESVKRLKGDGRPINPEWERARILCALECVDYVVVFNDDTPLELIKLVQPDVLVKGGDYVDKEIVGGKEVEGYGGIVTLLPYIDGKSTTNIIERIQQN